MKLCVKLLIASALFGLTAAKPVSAQGQLYANQAFRYTPAGMFPASGAIVTICTVSATETPCTPTVTVYQDSGLTTPVVLVNGGLPACTASPQFGCIDGLGNFSFYASPGAYTYSVTGSQLNPYGPIPFGVSCVAGVTCVANPSTVPFSVTNPGVFTNTQMNESLSSNLNSLNVGSLVSGLYAGNFMTDAVSGACNGPGSTAVLQCNGIAGYAVTQTGMNAVGVFGIGKSAVNSGRAWGANFLVTSALGLTNQNLAGLEMDVNVQNVSDFGQAWNCNGVWAAVSTNMNCIGISKPTGGQWTNGISFQTGATAAASSTSAAIDFQPVASGTNQVSQGITYVSADPVSGTHVGLNFLDASGDYIVNLPSKQWLFTPSGNLAVPGTIQNTTLTATMGLTLKKGSGAGNYTTASTTYVVPDSTNLCGTFTIPVGWKLGIQASGSIGTSTAIAAASAALTDNAACSTANAGLLAEAQVDAGAVGATAGFSLSWVITGDGNAHNVALQIKTAAGADSALLLNSSSTALPTMAFTLMPSN